jgi:cytochrome c556
MFIIGQHFGRLAPMVKGRQAYDQKKFAGNAAVVDTLAALPWEAFAVAGSDEGRTTMKSSALKNPADFKAEAQKFVTETGNLLNAASSDDVNAVKRQFGAVARSCKSCHSQFRK